MVLQDILIICVPLVSMFDYSECWGIEEEKK